MEISAASCNLGIRDPKNWFSASSLMRVFNLTLSDPFHRAVAIMIMHIIPAHRSYIIANSIWTGEDNGKSVTVKLDLAEKVVVDFASKRLNALQIKQIESLRKVKAAAEDTQNALVLFAEVDEDGSGLIDEDELGKMFDSLGLFTFLFVLCSHN